MAEGIRKRTFKVGIGSPIEHWANGPLKEWMMDMLSSERIKKNLFVLTQSEYDEMMKGYAGNPIAVRTAQRLWQEINAQILV
jgi:hypothetical protein